MVKRASIAAMLLLIGSILFFFQFPAPNTVLADEMVTITAGNSNQLRYDKTEIRVPKDTWINLTLVVTSSISHNLVIENFAAEGFQGTDRTAIISNMAGSDSIRFKTPNKDVTVIYYCSVGSHRALGMEGNLIVSGDSNPPPASSSSASSAPNPPPTSSNPPISSESIGFINGNESSSASDVMDLTESGDTSSVSGFQLISIFTIFLGLAIVTLRFKKKRDE